jgi:hypothetical protein
VGIPEGVVVGFAEGVAVGFAEGVDVGFAEEVVVQTVQSGPLGPAGSPLSVQLLFKKIESLENPVAPNCILGPQAQRFRLNAKALLNMYPKSITLDMFHELMS